MRNRAKCKLCKQILESFHEYDYVSCKCDEISISGGNIRYECAAKDWNNFVRVDDFDREIPVTVKYEDKESHLEVNDSKPSKNELINMLDKMILDIENLPDSAMLTPVNHYDLMSLLLLLSSLFKSDFGPADD